VQGKNVILKSNTMLTKSTQPSYELLKAAKSVFLAQAWEQTIRKPLENIKKELLLKGQYQTRERSRGEVKIITEPKYEYLMSDEDFASYQKLYRAEFIKIGFTDIEVDSCPLLIASSLREEAVRAMLDEAAKTTTITREKIWQSRNGLKNYEKVTELTLQWCAPYIDQKDILSELNKQKQTLNK
jgi:hypothetical protein